MVHQLVFQSPPETLDRGIIVAVAAAAHGDLHAELLKQFAVLQGAILAAPVGVVDQACRRPLGCDCAEKGLADQILRHSLAHCVAHDLSGEEVFVAGKIQPTLGGWDIGDIGHPDLVRGFGHKVLLQKVFGNRQGVVRIRRCLELFHLLAANAMGPADAFDPVDSDPNAMVGEVALKSFWAISFSVSLVSRLDFDNQPRL